MDFLDDGGSLYIETATIGTAGYTNFYPYLGLSNNSTPHYGYSIIEYLNGHSASFLNDFSLNYMYGSLIDYGNDRLAVQDGSVLLQSQDDYVHTVYHSGDNYNTIASSIFFGSMVDGNYTKAQVMEQFLIFMSGGPAPNISVEPAQIVFEIQFAGYPAVEILTVSNRGAETLFIDDITIEGEAFLYEGATEFEISSFEQVELEIQMDASVTGIYNGTLTIFSNDPFDPQLEIEICGNCVQPPILEFWPAAFEVEIAFDQQQDEILTLSNAGGYLLEFSIEAEEYIRELLWLELSNTNGSITPTNLTEITLTFDSSSLPPATYSANLIIISNDPALPEALIPLTLNVVPLNSGEIISQTGTKLGKNYPNPFNPSTTIFFEIDSSKIEHTELGVYNMKGQKIKELISGPLANGEYRINWNGRDENGEAVPSGLYFYKMRFGSYTSSGKMILLK